MFVGHFAAGLALKTVEPRTPTLGLMIGVGFLDLVYGVLVAFRVEGGSFDHFITPWSHSLVMAVVWSLAFAAVFWRLGVRIFLVLFAAVMSHWLLDLVSHKPDMELWPYSTIALGYGPLFGGLGGWFELATTLSGLAAYIVWARRPENRRRRWGVIAIAMIALYGVELAVVSNAAA